MYGLAKVRTRGSSRRMHTLEELLLQLGLGDLDLDGLVDLLLVAALVVGVVLDRGGEEGVDKGGLSESRLASNLSSLVLVCVRRKADHGATSGRPVERLLGRCTIIVKAAPLFATILCRWLGRLAMPMRDEESVAIVEVRLGAIPDATRDNWEDEY